MINTVYRLAATRRFEIAFEDIELFGENAVVRPTHLSICNADMRYYLGTRDPKVMAEKLPMALIHEGVGEVVFDPTETFKTGDKVVMVPNMAVEGNEFIAENYLRSSKFCGSTMDGFLQEYVSISPKRLVLLPKNVCSGSPWEHSFSQCRAARPGPHTSGFPAGPARGSRRRRKNKEHLLRQMLKLGAVGGILDQERRPVQYSRHGFGMSLQNSHLLFWYSLGQPLFRSRCGHSHAADHRDLQCAAQLPHPLQDQLRRRLSGAGLQSDQHQQLCLQP